MAWNFSEPNNYSKSLDYNSLSTGETYIFRSSTLAIASRSAAFINFLSQGIA